MDIQNTELINNDWQIINKRKRTISPIETTRQKTKPNESTQYWLAKPTNTHNYFDVLRNLPEQNDTPTNIKIIKPPPIFVHQVEDIKPLTTLLEEIASKKYSYTVINNNQIKIQAYDAHAYNIILKELKDKNTDMHSFQDKNKRSFKVVIRNLHFSTDVDDIKSEIESYGHTIIRISNMTHRITKAPLNLFLVELERKNNNGEIYNIEFLNRTKVLFEAKRQVKEIPQCFRCQRYGHTKSYCFRNPRCVKCAGNHHSKDCNLKEPINKDVKCVLCGENHPANYKGCSTYRKLLKLKFPSSRPQTNRSNFRNASIQPGKTFAQATHNNNENNNDVSFANDNNINHQNIFQNDISELKSMMKTLIEQMSVMLNLLTTVVKNNYK
uniref:Putative nucleic-acid-binding protein from transposon x-element n=1 Tax=Xenopsylla cheopis TaxID=163159 RepID=A0A6M2DQJ3_XENCH